MSDELVYMYMYVLYMLFYNYCVRGFNTCIHAHVRLPFLDWS